MYRVGYFPRPSTGTGTGLNPEQTRLLTDLKAFEDFGSEMFGAGTLNGHLQNVFGLAQTAKAGVDHLRLWREAVIPDKYAAEGSFSTIDSAQAWNKLLARDEVQPVVLQSAVDSDPNNTIVTDADFLPLLGWKNGIENWQGTMNAWKAMIESYQSVTYQILQRESGLFRLRPPNDKVTPNGFYVCFPTSHFTFTNNAEGFYFELGTHEPGTVDPIASGSFEFTVFNASPTHNVRVCANNGKSNQPILFVRGSAVSTQVSNTLIGYKQAVRFVYVPWAQSPYTRKAPNTVFEQQCPAFVETDWYFNTSPTLQPPNNQLLL